MSDKMTNDKAIENLYYARGIFEDNRFGKVEMVKYVESNKVAFNEAVTHAIDYLENNKTSRYEDGKEDGYAKGYADALALLEKEAKVIIINNPNVWMAGPTA